MRLDRGHSGAGTLAADEYRSERGLLAAELLKKGLGANCLTGDHTGSELCIETIIRKQNDVTKTAKWLDGTSTGLDTALRAAKNLAQGVGVHTVAGTHSGGNTCAAVIAGIADNF